jgi:hypothetical protein
MGACHSADPGRSFYRPVYRVDAFIHLSWRLVSPFDLLSAAPAKDQSAGP